MIEPFLIVRSLLNDGHVDVAIGKINGRADSFYHFHAKSRGVKFHQPLSILRYNGQMANAGHNASLLSWVIYIIDRCSLLLSSAARRQNKISFNIHAGELRREAVSDVERILDGLVVWDRDFIQVLGVHFV